MFQRPENLSARPCEITGTFAISSTLALRKPSANRPYISTTFADIFGPTPSIVSRELVFLTFALFLRCRANRVIM